MPNQYIDAPGEEQAPQTITRQNFLTGFGTVLVVVGASVGGGVAVSWLTSRPRYSFRAKCLAKPDPQLSISTAGGYLHSVDGRLRNADLIAVAELRAITFPHVADVQLRPGATSLHFSTKTSGGRYLKAPSSIPTHGSNAFVCFDDAVEVRPHEFSLALEQAGRIDKIPDWFGPIEEHSRCILFVDKGEFLGPPWIVSPNGQVNVAAFDPMARKLFHGRTLEYVVGQIERGLHGAKLDVPFTPSSKRFDLGGPDITA